MADKQNEESGSVDMCGMDDLRGQKLEYLFWVVQVRDMRCWSGMFVSAFFSMLPGEGLKC
jgi:hypothetical protein